MPSHVASDDFRTMDFDRKGSEYIMNIIVITGASSGIGKEFALQLDRHFKNIDEFWLIARSRNKLRTLAAGLTHKCRIIDIDVTNEEQLKRLSDALVLTKPNVRMLINCAGYGLMGAFAEQDRNDTLGMVRLNCEALTAVTHMFLPYLKRNSRVIQLASSAAFVPQIDFAVYAATKSYVLSFSRALGAELRDKGIYVTAVCPGPVDTPFFDRAEQTGSTLSIKKYSMVSATKVVKKALKDSYQKKSTSVCSLPIQAFNVLCKVVPHDKMLELTGKMKMVEQGSH